MEKYIARDNRQFINAVFWIMRTGAPWRWICRRITVIGVICIAVLSAGAKGMWERLLEVLIDEADYEWRMIDASHCKVHPHAAGARGGNQDMSRTKGGNTKIHLAA